MAQSSLGYLDVATAFCLFVFVDEMLEVIEFGWSNILGRPSECVPSDPLHERVIDHRKWRYSSRNEKADT
jgi:hypothetical protein